MGAGIMRKRVIATVLCIIMLTSFVLHVNIFAQEDIIIDAMMHFDKELNNSLKDLDYIENKTKFENDIDDVSNIENIINIKDRKKSKREEGDVKNSLKYKGGNSLKINNTQNIGYTDYYEYRVNDDNTVTIISFFEDEYRGGKTLVLPSVIGKYTVTGIGDKIFYTSERINTVVISKTIKNIASNAFSECNSIRNIKVDEGNLNYKDTDGVLFSKDGSILYKYPEGRSDETYIMPSGVTTIYADAFNRTLDLNTIVISKDVSSIDETSFLDCPSLCSFFVDSDNQNYKDINGGLFSKDETIFYKCPNFNKDGMGDTYVVPESVLEIDKYAFYKSFVENIKVSENNKNYKDIDGVLFSKDGAILYKYPYGRSSDSKYVIPSGVDSIEDSAFLGCSSLVGITIPSGVTDIGISAFEGCSSLLNIILPDGVDKIKENTFRFCFDLKSVTIPDSVDIISEYAFNECSSLKNVKMGGGVTSIGMYAFWNCFGIENITLSNKLESIGEGAFNSCSMLKNAVIPGSVTTIDKDAFYCCESLLSVVVPKSVTNLGKDVFGHCNNVVVYVYKDSYAKNYCRNNKIKYKEYINFIKSSSIKFSLKSKRVSLGKILTLKVLTSPKNATVRNFLWGSNNKKVVTVSNYGKAVSKKVGKVVVTVATLDGSNLKCNIALTVVPERVSKVKIKAGKKKAMLTITKAKGAKKYEIYRSTKKKRGFKKVATVVKTKYTNKKLKSKKTYYYKVRAIDGKYKGDFSKLYKVKVK